METNIHTNFHVDIINLIAHHFFLLSKQSQVSYTLQIDVKCQLGYYKKFNDSFEQQINGFSNIALNQKVGSGSAYYRKNN